MSGMMRMFVAGMLLAAGSVNAQVATPAHPHTVSEVVDYWVTDAEQLLVPAAEAMPDEKYSFAPSNGEFSGVRTFAEQVKHLAAANYQLAAATLSEEPPAGTDHETAPDSVKTKAQIVDYLKGSFASLHRAASALNENNMNDPIATKGSRTRLLMLIDAVVHSSNHYGQMVEYLRMNNIIPPASRVKVSIALDARAWARAESQRNLTKNQIRRSCEQDYDCNVAGVACGFGRTWLDSGARNPGICQEASVAFRL